MNGTEPTQRILFIEDEPRLLDSVSQLLREQGFLVAAFPDAEKALAHLRNTAVDIILADIKLPGIDGFDFLAEIRKDPRYLKTPIIFVTAFNNIEAQLYAKKIGVREYITKPFEVEYLISQVRKHLLQKS